MKNKILSIVITLSIIAGITPAFAEEISGDFYEYLEEPTPIPQNEVYSSIDDNVIEEAANEENTFEQETTEEMVYGPIDLSDLDDVPTKQSMMVQDGISLFSTDETEENIWNSFYTEQFGDDFLDPYGRKKESKQVSGNSNRFVVEETDLSLEGKNGLNVEITRRHDNQLFDWSFRCIESMGARKIDILLSKFRRSDTQKEVYIGFISEDDYYKYMYEGMMVKEMTRVYTTEGGIEFYLFNELYKKQTDTGIYLYNISDGITRKTRYDSYDNRDLQEIYNSLKAYSIGEDWELVLPEANLYLHSKYTDNDDSQKFVSYEVSGVFRGMDGVVYGLSGTQSLTKYETDIYKYRSDLRFNDNKHLSMTSSFEPKSFENGIKYNYVVTDNRGITYYLYNTDFEENALQVRQTLKIVAVKDNYNNTIYYKYNESDGNLSKIIDTYGREITFTYGNNSTEISYFDTEAQTNRTIKYEHEDLPASALNNDSPLKYKGIKRLKVTNQNGETTIYDSR